MMHRPMPLSFEHLLGTGRPQKSARTDERYPRTHKAHPPDLGPGYSCTEFPRPLNYFPNPGPQNNPWMPNEPRPGFFEVSHALSETSTSNYYGSSVNFRDTVIPDTRKRGRESRDVPVRSGCGAWRDSRLRGNDGMAGS